MIWLILNLLAVAFGIAAAVHPALIAFNAFVAGAWAVALVDDLR